MAVWDKGILCSFVLLLADAAGPQISYPPAVCAVEGSTVSLPCSFTPKTPDTPDTPDTVEIIRVVWCQNHTICQGTTPSVYDSNSTTSSSRFTYLGDMKGDCSLQITRVQKKDSSTYRFRMEANNHRAHFTNQTGVLVTVTDVTRMKINSSRGETQLTRGGTVTLRCTARCTFHQLEVTWFRDRHALPESSPALQLGPLTAENSGNYTCGLKTISDSLSLPYSLQVEAEDREQKDSASLAVGVTFSVLLALLTFIIVFCIIRRRRAAADKDQRSAEAQVDQQHPDYIYSSVLQPAESEGGGRRQESSRAAEVVSYASVQFKHKDQARPAQEPEVAVIYSTVASRG